MGDFQSKYPWELCTTMTIGAWGYQPDAKLKTRDEIILLLVSAVGRDGNLLLNVGPRPDGQIDPAYAARLREVGEWLKQYGQSICGTGGPIFRETLVSPPTMIERFFFTLPSRVTRE